MRPCWEVTMSTRPAVQRVACIVASIALLSASVDAQREAPLPELRLTVSVKEQRTCSVALKRVYEIALSFIARYENRSDRPLTLIGGDVFGAWLAWRVETLRKGGFDFESGGDLFGYTTRTRHQLAARTSYEQKGRTVIFVLTEPNQREDELWRPGKYFMQIFPMDLRRPDELGRGYT